LNKIESWLTEESGILSELPPDARAAKLGEIARNITYNGGNNFAYPTQGGKTLVVVSSSPYSDDLGLGNGDKAASYRFFHELGHVIVKDGLHQAPTSAEQQKNDQSEHAVKGREDRADSFAALWTQKIGALTPADIEKVAQARALEALYSKNLSHLTTEVLRTLKVNPEAANITSLTPQEISAIAENHSKKHARTPEEMDVTRRSIDSYAQKHEHVWRYVRQETLRNSALTIPQRANSHAESEKSLKSHFGSVSRRQGFGAAIASKFVNSGGNAMDAQVSASLVDAAQNLKHAPKPEPRSNHFSV
jgi:hypothetical protein